jgi:hypothetical protein
MSTMANGPILMHANPVTELSGAIGPQDPVKTARSYTTAIMPSHALVPQNGQVLAASSAAACHAQAVTIGAQSRGDDSYAACRFGEGDPDMRVTAFDRDGGLQPCQAAGCLGGARESEFAVQSPS